jgi:hypothetical protein
MDPERGVLCRALFAAVIARATNPDAQGRLCIQIDEPRIARFELLVGRAVNRFKLETRRSPQTAERQFVVVQARATERTH